MNVPRRRIINAARAPEGARPLLRKGKPPAQRAASGEITR